MEVDVDASLLEHLGSVQKKYLEKTHPRVKIIDWTIFYMLILIFLQLFYRIVVGDDFPKNAFYSGILTPLGMIVLLLSIREEKKDLRKLG